MQFGAVVALVDGTTSSEAALPFAASWAAALDRELVVLTVAEDALSRLDGTTPNRFGPEDPQAYVTALVGRLSETVPNVRGEVVRDPLNVSSGVRRYLSQHQSALLVLAATRRSGLERLRLGATAAEIVRRSTIPALIVPMNQPDRPRQSPRPESDQTEDSHDPRRTP